MIKNLSIWKKFFLGFIIIVAILIFITGNVATRLFYTGIEQRAELTLSNNLNSFGRQLHRRLDNILLILKCISNECGHDYFFKEAIKNNNLLYMQKLLPEYKEQNNLSFLIISDPSGKIIFSANNELSANERISEEESFLTFMGEEQKGITVLEEDFITRENLDEQAYVTIIPTPEARFSEKDVERRGLALTASEPIYNDDDELIAILWGGELLNRHFAFVDEITEVLKVTSTVFLDDLRIATSIRLENGERAIGTRVSEEVASVVLDQGKRYLGRALILDQWYLTAYDPIFDNNNEVVGILYVGVPEEPFVQMKNEIMSNFTWAVACGIIVAIILAYFITRSITNPLHRLIAAMQKVEHGDLSQRFFKKNELSNGGNNSSKDKNPRFLPGIKIHEKDGDEIQHLGNFFNRMMESLQTNWQRNKELQEKLEEKDKMRLHLLNKIITSQEEERKRISRELHDETSQSLTGLLLGLKLIQEADNIEEVRRLVGNYREIIYKTIEEIQWLSYELRPSSLDDLGLCVALNRYVKELSKHAGINIEYIHQDFEEKRLGSVVETTVYRVVQEALTNAIRHAEAQNVKVSLNYDHKNIKAIIEDDGKGFDLNKVQKDQRSLGLFGMAERASQVGGELIVDTAPGEGTRIILIIPDVAKLSEEKIN